MLTKIRRLIHLLVRLRTRISYQVVIDEILGMIVVGQISQPDMLVRMEVPIREDLVVFVHLST